MYRDVRQPILELADFSVHAALEVTSDEVMADNGSSTATSNDTNPFLLIAAKEKLDEGKKLLWFVQQSTRQAKAASDDLDPDLDAHMQHKLLEAIQKCM